MNAGKTNIQVGAKVRITEIFDPENQSLIGLVGAITHPFPGLMTASPDEYVAGLYIDDAKIAAKHGLGLDRLGLAKINICRDDAFEIVANAESRMAKRPKKTKATYDDLALLLAEGMDGAEPAKLIAALKGLFPDIRIQETPKAYRYWFTQEVK